MEPSAYGTIAIVTVFITIFYILIDSGFGEALIQKLHVDDLDYATVFYFNIAFCLFVYLIMYFMAPFIANFYGDENLVFVIRILSLVIIVYGFTNVMQAYIRSNFISNKSFIASIISTFIGAILGIASAYCGYGVWALVFQQLSATIVNAIILWIVIPWKPIFAFSFKRLKPLFSFGWKLLLTNIITIFFSQLNQLVIGKIYETNSLAYYNQGNQFPAVIVTNISYAVGCTLLPAMSENQNNINVVKNIIRRTIKLTTYIIAPCMFGLIFSADILIPVLLTDKWSACIFFLRVFCVVYLLYPINSANINAYNAIGRSDISLKLEIVKKSIGFLLLVLTMFISVEAMAIGVLISAVLSQIINAMPNKKLFDYSYFQQIKDISPEVLLSVFMGICVYFIKFITLPNIVILLLQLFIGVGIYWLFSALLHLESYVFIVNYIKSIFIKEKLYST